MTRTSILGGRGRGYETALSASVNEVLQGQPRALVYVHSGFPRCPQQLSRCRAAVSHQDPHHKVPAHGQRPREDVQNVLWAPGGNPAEWCCEPQTRRARAFPQKASGLMFWVPGHHWALLPAVSPSWHKADFLLNPELSPTTLGTCQEGAVALPSPPRPNARHAAQRLATHHTGNEGGSQEGSTLQRGALRATTAVSRTSLGDETLHSLP